MKKLLLIMLMYSVSMMAQTHRFIYEYKFKTDSTSKEHRKVNMVLDVNPQNVKFYNYDFVVTDSVNKKTGSNNIVWDDTPALIRKRNSNTNANYIHLQNMFIIETNDAISWKLHDETKVVDTYTLQKATSKYGGRFWTAWFSKDIVFNEGPYKFKGLPGLIMEVYDDKDNFKFSLIKSYKLSKTYDTSSILEHFAGQTPVKITEERLRKMMIDNYNDPLRDFKTHYKNNTDPNARFMVMGVEVKSPEQIKELSDKLRKHMKENNNPIEIDKAIHY
ncbi:GLPGLI family protein [Chryseobacterium oryctis]|uniref:GLPGLI family protein n=1 Tax=Chryseobacterium oryctis TaxID=2952618 RepID=A0ABT3HQR9_9FLAO|nr:GLPGLI family protein [Chryseobacterium oryctis]MCW3162098.1 GLPGLI family protein [Chryseobacterium oryctis]